MFIYTDDIKFAEKVIGRDFKWDKLISSSTEESIKPLIKNLYNKSFIFGANIGDLEGWNYLLVTKYARKSQYDTLVDLSRRGFNLPDKILTFADSGDAFHGFRNRHWNSISGNIHLSAFLTPRCEIENFWIGFMIISAISVVQTIDSISELENLSSIKWVNDIYLGGSKVGGILSYTQSIGKVVTSAVVGIGINVEKTPDVELDQFVPRVTSLRDYLSDGEEIDQGVILKRVISFLSRNYQILLDGGYRQLIEFYKRRSNIMNRRVRIISDSQFNANKWEVQGKVVNIGENLELFLEGVGKPVLNGRLILEE